MRTQGPDLNGWSVSEIPQWTTFVVTILLLLFNGLLKNYSNRRQRQNYRNSNNIKSTMYKQKKIDIKTITQKKRRSL